MESQRIWKKFLNITLVVLGLIIQIHIFMRYSSIPFECAYIKLLKKNLSQIYLSAYAEYAD